MRPHPSIEIQRLDVAHLQHVLHCGSSEFYHADDVHIQPDRQYPCSRFIRWTLVWNTSILHSCVLLFSVLFLRTASSLSFISNRLLSLQSFTIRRCVYHRSDSPVGSGIPFYSSKYTLTWLSISPDRVQLLDCLPEHTRLGYGDDHDLQQSSDDHLQYLHANYSIYAPHSSRATASTEREQTRFSCA